MQHDYMYVLKKFNIDLLTPGGGDGKWVCGHNIGYHIAAFVILSNLICNMTVF